MKGFFEFSYVFLWGLIILEALLLRQVLRKTVWFKRLYVDLSRRTESINLEQVRPGVSAPDFMAPVLGTGQSLNLSHLKGHSSILLFVSPEEKSPLYNNLTFAIHAMWHKTSGHLYLVCNGSEEACRQFARDHRVEGFAEDKVPVILDQGGQIARHFLIERTPQAASLDKDGQVNRYGQPVLPDPEIAGEHPAAFDDVSSAAKTAGSPLTAEQTEPMTDLSEMNPTDDNGGEKRCSWPDDRLDTGASFARMESTVSCVLTRFRLRSAWSLIPFYLAFRRVRRSSRVVSGLLQATFLVEDLHTCYTMSMWKDDCAIVDFGRVSSHITAANSAFHRTYRQDLKRAEIWSAQFRLWAVSCHNLNWEGFDLQPILGEQWERRQTVAQAGLGDEE